MNKDLLGLWEKNKTYFGVAVFMTLAMIGIGREIQAHIPENMIERVRAESIAETIETPRDIRESTKILILQNPETGYIDQSSSLATEIIESKNGDLWVVLLGAAHSFENKNELSITEIKSQYEGEIFGNERRCIKVSGSRDTGLCGMNIGKDLELSKRIKTMGGIGNIKHIDQDVLSLYLYNFGYVGPYDSDDSLYAKESMLSEMQILNNGDIIADRGMIIPGQSGGPIYDLDGKVVGVNSKCDYDIEDYILGTFPDGGVGSGIPQNFPEIYNKFIEQFVVGDAG